MILHNIENFRVFIWKNEDNLLTKALSKSLTWEKLIKMAK